MTPHRPSRPGNMYRPKEIIGTPNFALLHDAVYLDHPQTVMLHDGREITWAQYELLAKGILPAHLKPPLPPLMPPNVKPPLERIPETRSMQHQRSRALAETSKLAQEAERQYGPPEHKSPRDLVHDIRSHHAAMVDAMAQEVDRSIMKHANANELHDALTALAPESALVTNVEPDPERAYQVTLAPSPDEQRGTLLEQVLRCIHGTPLDDVRDHITANGLPRLILREPFCRLDAVIFTAMPVAEPAAFHVKHDDGAPIEHAQQALQHLYDNLAVDAPPQPEPFDIQQASYADRLDGFEREVAYLIERQAMTQESGAPPDAIAAFLRLALDAYNQAVALGKPMSLSFGTYIPPTQ